MGVAVAEKAETRGVLAQHSEQPPGRYRHLDERISRVQAGQQQYGQRWIEQGVEYAKPKEVCVQGLAQPWLVPTIRVVAGDLAARADFDLDAIADVRMAVDEACVTLLRLSDPSHPLWCSFLVWPDRIEIDVRALLRDGSARVDTRGFGWHVLQSLVDEVTYVGGHGQELAIRLVKRQPNGY
jgi:serine/threonine-protein kinase RsbW